jgi:arylsulfatase A-like enzyme
VLIILDTVRAASLSLYGYGRPTTPHLDRLQGEATVFDRAFSVAPWTLPSHGSMFTGRYAGELSTDWRRSLDRADPTLAEVLRDRGYSTVGVVGNLRYTAHETGLGRGFLRYEDHHTSFGQLLRSAWLGQTEMIVQALRARDTKAALSALASANLWVDPNRDADPRRARSVTDTFLAWHAGHSAGRPFFAFLNYFDAHTPIVLPPEYEGKFGEQPVDLYDGAIAYLDAEIGRLLASLAARGALDNTIVVITSDHGELLGEHGLVGHAHNLYARTLHVPLLMRWPSGVPAGKRIAEPVTLRDLAATITTLAGGVPAGTFPGRSLSRFWNEALRGDDSPIVAEVNRGVNPEPSMPT